LLNDSLVDTDMEQMRNSYKIVFGKPQGKKPLTEPRRRWEDNIKMDLKGIGYALYPSSSVGTSYEHGNEPPCSISDGEFLDQMSNYELLRKSCAPTFVY
jgi:hypothetical protein